MRLTGIDAAYETTQDKIAAECDDIKELLISKNKAYGDSALSPVRVFSKANTTEQIKVRIDDKISRLQRGTATEAVPEDTVRDLIGYLILLLIAEGSSARTVRIAPQPVPADGWFTDKTQPATGGIVTGRLLPLLDN